MLEQLHHLARVRGLTHLVLEVAENNENALRWYRRRGFRKLDAAIFMAAGVETEPELLPPRELTDGIAPRPGEAQGVRSSERDARGPAGKKARRKGAARGKRGPRGTKVAAPVRPPTHRQ